MRVEDRAVLQSGGLSEAQKTERADLGAAGRTAGATAAGGDQLQLSSLAARIRQTFENLGADHARHVEEVARQYQSGTYTVDARRLSRAMLANLPAET